jgi:uncharacterized membrane protein
MTVEIFVLRLLHVLGGVFWVGTVIFMSGFMMPALAGNGAATGAVLGGLQRRKFMVILPVVALLTLLTGLRLIWIASGGFTPAYFHTPTGGTFAGAGLLAIVAFLIGLLVARPAAVRAAQLAPKLESASPAEREAIVREMGSLRARNATSMTLVTALLALTTAGMAVARYL